MFWCGFCELIAGKLLDTQQLPPVINIDFGDLTAWLLNLLPYVWLKHQNNMTLTMFFSKALLQKHDTWMMCRLPNHEDPNKPTYVGKLFHQIPHT